MEGVATFRVCGSKPPCASHEHVPVVVLELSLVVNILVEENTFFFLSLGHNNALEELSTSTLAIRPRMTAMPLSEMLVSTKSSPHVLAFLSHLDFTFPLLPQWYAYQEYRCASDGVEKIWLPGSWYKVAPRLIPTPVLCVRNDLAGQCHKHWAVWKVAKKGVER